MNIAVLGAVFGDEGKGHITHHFSKDYDWVVRFNGGANAGHTIYRNGIKYVHNLMPSFDWRSPKPKAYLGSGMVIDLEQLHKEVLALYEVDKSLPTRVYVDLDAFMVLPEHKEEDKKSNSHIGTTNRGIGPAYKSKIARQGLRIRDCVKPGVMFGFIGAMQTMGVHFVNLLEMELKMKNSSILYEGAQGILLDINHGTYPYVSCSEATVAGVYSAGFSFAPPEKVYGVTKCYSTKVGEGPFPTEIFGEEAENLRKLGNEYGSTTGRPRRIGWLDLPALNYACKKGGITELIVTKLDILNGMKTVPVCHKYEKTPVCPADFFNTTPSYIKAWGWENAKEKLDLADIMCLIEDHTNLPVTYISCGTSEGDIMKL